MVLKKACCCIDLAVGAEILGWLGFISGTICLTNIQTQSYLEIIYENVMAEILGCVIQIIICACLISGVRSKSEALLLPWLILNLIGFVLINFIICGQARDVIHKQEVTPFIAGLFIVDFIFSYLWLIVLSLYINFDQQHRMVAIEYKSFDNTRLIHSGKNGEENYV